MGSGSKTQRRVRGLVDRSGPSLLKPVTHELICATGKRRVFGTVLGVQRNRKRSRRRAEGGHVLGCCVLGVSEACHAQCVFWCHREGKPTYISQTTVALGTKTQEDDKPHGSDGEQLWEHLVLTCLPSSV